MQLTTYLISYDSSSRIFFFSEMISPFISTFQQLNTEKMHATLHGFAQILCFSPFSSYVWSSLLPLEGE
jgi:hypothetical protein